MDKSTNHFSKKDIQSLKCLNPKIKILVYHSLPEIKDYDPKLKEGFFDEHEQWFLHCKDNGQRVIFKPGTLNNYFADISNEEYREFWIQRTKKVIEDCGYDGVFVDVTSYRFGLTPN